MLNISYNISPRLNEYLSQIENLRKQILLTPITPEAEFQLKWNAIFKRTYCLLKLTGNPLGKSEVLKTLTGITRRKMNHDQQEIIRYKKAQDYIFQNWLGSEKPVDAQAIIALYKIIGDGKLRVPQAGLQHLLDYIQASSENPVIQAAIMCIEMEKMQLFSKNNKQIACLTSLLFLYKYGWDFKGFMAYEVEWLKDEKKYKENCQRAQITINLTIWLEYFANSVLKQAEAIIFSLKTPKQDGLGLTKSFLTLNERQKSILDCLDQPQAGITNRQVQEEYKVSQITASRDLAKLTNLRCLFSHGKGRSVYYTKI